jgi:hypothetical protein
MQGVLKVSTLLLCRHELKGAVDKVNIHQFDDNIPMLQHITKLSWFVRLTLAVAGGTPRLNVRKKKSIKGFGK